MTEAFLKYLQYQKRASSHTVTSYKHDLQQFQTFLEQTAGVGVIADAEFQAIRSFVVFLVESGLESVSVNRKIASLKAFYKFLLKHEKITRDPMLRISMLKTKKRLPKFIREDEIQRVMDDATAENRPEPNSFEQARDVLILELFYATGMRLSELLALRDNDLDLRACTVKVLGKRNKERIIPFGKNLTPLIKSYLAARARDVDSADDRFFVTISGRPCYPTLIYRMVRKHLQATTADRKSPHVLRHTFATHLLNKGAEINAVKELLGHSSLAATQVYTHNSIDKLKKVFDQAHPKA